MNDTPDCRCESFTHPAIVTNPPGREHIAYRIGDYTSFRRALLLALPDEVQLASWKPTGGGDLALQLMEWWAYLADVLTFYNERIANQDYLRTTDLEESAKRLIRLLGYRPRPGIGAVATLAALVSATKPLTLPQGFAVQSKPGPGQSPQTFELDAPTAVSPLDEVSADPPPVTATLGEDGTVLLQGTISSIKPADRLVVAHKNWNGSDTNYAIATVSKITQESDPRGASNTRVKFTGTLGLPAGANPADYRLLRSAQSTRLWQYTGASTALRDNGNGTGTANLEGIVREIAPGEIILLTGPSSGPFGDGGVITLGNQNALIAARAIDSTPFLESARMNLALFPPVLHLASVRSYTEAIWYANSTGDPTVPPDTQPIPILNSQITFAPAYSGSFSATTFSILYDWRDVGTLIPTPAKTFTTNAQALHPVDPATFPAGSFPILLEGADGTGLAATGFTGADTTSIQLSNLPQDQAALSAPVNVLYNLLKFSRGSSVPKEVLGSGDASTTGQEFVLKKSPLTYLLSADSTSSGNFKSTLRVWVNGLEWTEAQSFYNQPPTAEIFVTREDEKNQTHVMFGDGVNGARLPSGTNNVVANYRFGSGAQSPDAGSLTSIITPYPGLSGIRNPVAASGGADPEPASQIKRYAPLSVLTFGRAVSDDDYEATAALTPGVARARAYWSFDALQQRTAVTVYVGDDDGARAAALLSLRADADPNRPVIVKLAKRVRLQVSFTVLVHPKYIAEDVVAAVRQSLLEPQKGLFGAQRIAIGEAIYLSRIHEASLSIAGAQAVHDLQVSKTSFQTSGNFTSNAYRLDPGEGGYFTLNDADLSISTEVLADAG